MRIDVQSQVNKGYGKLQRESESAIPFSKTVFKFLFDCSTSVFI